MKKLILVISLIFFLEITLGFAEPFYTSEDFKEIFLKEIKGKLSWIDGEFYLEKFKIEPEEIKILKQIPYKAEFVSSPKIGSNVLILEFKEGQVLQRVKIWGYVEVRIPVVVLKRPILNKNVISEEDVDLELKPFSKLPQDVILDKGAVLGKEVRMGLKAGTILRYSHLQNPVMIKRNQAVYILAKGRNFIVKAKGIALQDGKEGNFIKVKNLSSKKVLLGKVISSEEVEVPF